MSRGTLVLVALVLGAGPARADLERAQRQLDQYRFQEAYREANRCRREDPKRSELLQIWALNNMLRGEEARLRLRAFRPDPACARLYLIVDAMLHSENRSKDLEQALDLSNTPAERVDILLRQFRAEPFPKDQGYWEQAAEIASRHPLPDQLLVRLSLAHVNLLCSLKRPQEGFAELALARRLLGGDPSGAWRIELARVELLNALGKVEEARAVRLRLPELTQDSRQALGFLLNQVEARSETSRAGSQQILQQLQRLRSRAKDWDRRLDLYAFRLRSSVAQVSQLGLEEWRRQADTLCRSSLPDERLLGLSERGLVLGVLGRIPESVADLTAAYALARPRTGSELLANAQPRLLSLALAQMEQAQQHYAAAEKWGRLSLRESGQDSNSLQAARLCLLGVYLRTAQIGAARQTLDEIMATAEKEPAPLQRSIAYSQLLSTLIVSSLESSRLLEKIVPLRVDPDTPAGWLFAEIREDPQRQARIFKALSDLKSQSSHPALRGVEGLFRAMTLASLDRPLEALDAYAEAMDKSAGYGALEANTGLLYSQELWGAGRRQQALEVLRKAYLRAQGGSVFGQAENYALAYANALIEAGSGTEAVPVIEEGLRRNDPHMRAYYLLLRARATGSPADLHQAMALAESDRTREEILLQLQRLEPDQPWLDQVRSRTPKRALQLMELSSPPRALQIGHEALEQFRETFEQLPVSARPAALRSPGLQQLIQAILEVSLKADQPQQGAHCLAVWRALQSQPAQVSPELEQLRAELTGLRSANDPKLTQRLADTRAQFLLKLNQLRQLNPEMEKSLSAQVSELLTLQPHLDEQTLLVQYYLAPDGLYVQALSRDQQQLFKVNLEKARLLEHLERWTGALRQPRPCTAEERSAGRLLYSHLIEPLGPLRQNHPNLWIMPSAELWDLPFETLLDPQDHYLLESSTCAYLGPSEAMQLAQPPLAAGGQWLGVSNARLPGTLEEIGKLRSLFPDSRVTQSWNELKTLVGGARILHLATHSQARPDQATESYLEMAEGPIALDQIYNLSLTPGSLVVLSSCSGAVPQRGRERDLISLSSGFRAAGASTVIAALWPIDDQATVPFFAPMYQALLQGQTRAQALRQAKLALIQQPPYYWAGFTLLGDPR